MLPFMGGIYAGIGNCDILKRSRASTFTVASGLVFLAFSLNELQDGEKKPFVINSQLVAR